MCPSKRHDLKGWAAAVQPVSNFNEYINSLWIMPYHIMMPRIVVFCSCFDVQWKLTETDESRLTVNWSKLSIKAK